LITGLFVLLLLLLLLLLLPPPLLLLRMSVLISDFLQIFSDVGGRNIAFFVFLKFSLRV
jgi:hypothetical protein